MHVDPVDRRVAALYAVAASITAATAALLGDPRLFGPWWFGWPVATAAVCAFASTVTPLHRKAPAAAVVRAVCWLAAGGWVGWGYQFGVTDLRYWQAWAFAALALGVLAAVFATPTDYGEPMRPAAAATAPQRPEWADRIARVAKVDGCHDITIERWPGGYGYDVAGLCPDDGTTWMDLQAHESGLASNLSLPHGCGVTVAPGENRRGFVIRVNTRDAMVEDRGYLDEFPDLEPLSIAGAIPFGRHRDGSWAQGEMRQRNVLLVGEVGSGKTNMQETINAGLVRCPDVFLCVIDLNGGDMPRQWLTPWIEERAERPAVGWAATTVDEAVLLTGWALEVSLARKTVYADFRRRKNSRLLPVSADLPAIIVVVDEGAETTGLLAHRGLQRNIVRGVELGRGMGVRYVFSGLRSTAEILPTEAMVQMGLRIGMRVSDLAEVQQQLFSWRQKLDLADVPYVGSGWWRDGGSGPVQPFRSWHTDPPVTIDEVAVRCARWRPDMDEPSLAGIPANLREAYSSRWDRVVPALTGAVPAVQPVQATSNGGMAVDLGPVDAAMDRLRAAARSTRAVRDEFDEITRHLGPLDDVPRLDGDTLPRAAEPRARMMQLLDGAGETGMSGPKLAEALRAEGADVPIATLYRWLKTDAVDGGYGSYLHPRHRRP